MAQLLQGLRSQIAGEVVDVELEREDGRWVYEFKIIDDKGWLHEVYVDTQTGKILSRKHD
jgi:uncharacterized membrane protein YkoI